MADITFGWFDLVYWLVAFSVAYYVAFVFDIQKFFSKAEENEKSRIKASNGSKDDSLKLEKFFGCILYNSKSNVAEKLAHDLHADSKTRNIPLQTNPIESFNFDAFNHFKNDYPVIVIIDGRCQELEKFIDSCSKDDGKVQAYSRTFLNNISFAAYSVDVEESTALSNDLKRIGAKTMYTQKAADNFLTWKENLFANLTSKKYK